MRFVKVLVVILVAAVLLLAGVQFYFSNVEPTRYSTRVADAVRDAIGRELSAVGSTELNVSRFRPSWCKTCASRMRPGALARTWYGYPDWKRSYA